MKLRISGEYHEISPIRNWQPHTGIDLAISENTTLRAIGEGVIDKVFDGSGAIGKGLSIKFEDGSRAIYGHMNEVSQRVGNHVSMGDIIGKSGNTGNSSGAHLHFGLKDPNGEFTDPTPLAEKIGALTGDNVSVMETQGVLSKLLWKSTDGLREHVADVSMEILLGIFDVIKDLLFAGTLLGAGILILLKVGGYKDGGRWAGVLIVANVLLKYLFGSI